MSDHKTVLVLGGGVGGLVAANCLRKLLSARHRVVLIDRERQAVFQPSLLWVAVDEHHPMSRGEQLPKTIGGDEAADTATEHEYCLVVTHEPVPA